MKIINQLIVQPNVPNNNNVIWIHDNTAKYYNNGTWTTLGDSNEDRKELEEKVDSLDKEMGEVKKDLMVFGSKHGVIELEIGNSTEVKTANLKKLKSIQSNDHTFFTDINYGYGTASWNDGVGGVAFIITAGGTAKPYSISADGSVQGGIDINLKDPNTDIFIILEDNEELPTNESEIKGKIYCKKNPDSTAGDNQYNEYIYVKSTKKWEKIGEFQATPDLSGYAKLSGAYFTGSIVMVGNSAIVKSNIDGCSVRARDNKYLYTRSINNPNITYATDGSLADVGTKEPFIFTLEDGTKVTKSIRVISTTSQAGA